MNFGFETQRIGFNYDTVRLMRARTGGQKELTTSRANHGAKRPPGRPRSEEARQAILRSTLDVLLRAGYQTLSIEAIAADADVSKATVYRWWPNKAALIADAFRHSSVEELRFPDTGSVRTDLSLQMRQLARILRSKRGKIVAVLLGGGQSDPALVDAFREYFMLPRRRDAYATVKRGIERGELRPDLDADILLDSLYGAMYFRFLARHSSLTDEFIEQLCDTVIPGCKPPKH